MAERLRYETEVFKTIVLITAAVGGGSIGLFLGEHTPLRLSLAGVGSLGTIGLASIAWRSDQRIRRLIEEIQENV